MAMSICRFDVRRIVRRAFARGMATVSSVRPESTMMVSSAQEALSMAAVMWSASLRVMMVTETFGTPGILIRNQESGRNQESLPDS
jgi:hypothetical protein